ncbi:MAG: hypothetical protein JO112_08615 [Planctomycetes bacterium]|nr:hypothetical protein [Planctomycetota bacterium]
MQRTELLPYEAAILGRLVVPDKLRLSPAAAEAILALGFDQTDKDRMHELAAKARAGTLTPEEQTEVEAYSRIGSLLGILQSRVRLALKDGRRPTEKARPN